MNITGQITFGLLLLFIAILWRSNVKDDTSENVSSPKVLKYWTFVLKMWNPNDNLKTHKTVFDRFGMKGVNGSVDDSWDILWSIEHPFEKFPERMRNLKPHQMVNHMLGIASITNKAFMVTHNRFDFIPRAFEFPGMTEEFHNYSQLNPDKRYVVKNEFNRGVKLVKLSDINFKSYGKKFYQEFVENPLLIDGRVFDFGVYVLITSVNPLRIYRYKSEVLARFCPEPYYPFDPNNTNKYVIYETQKTTVEMPSLGDMITKMGFSFKTSIETHLRSRGFNIKDLWSQIDNVILTLFLANEAHISNKRERFPFHENTFDLVRFDFIIDNDFKVHLMEVNMSPNLTPVGERFKSHSLGYEQLVFNALQCVVGISFYPGHQTRLNIENLLKSFR